MNTSSTTLRYWNRHCAAAALRQLNGEEIDRAPFGAGVAAHAALEAMARDPKHPLKAARQAAGALMAGERLYKGRREPPYAPDAVMEGLRIATRWFEEVAAPRGRAEVGIAVNSDWEIVEYEAPHHYGQILDIVRIFEDEGEDGEQVRVLRIEDYKTAWSTGPAEIDSVQMHGAACLGAALAEREGCGAVELQLANVRKLRWIPKVPRRLYHRQPVDGDTIRRWREEIDLVVGSLEKIRGADPDEMASPGAGCSGCPFRERCGPAQAALSIPGVPVQDQHRMCQLSPRVSAAIANDYLTRRALLDISEAELKRTADEGAIDLLAGSELGFHPKERRVLRDDAIPLLSEALHWTPREESLVLNAKLTGGNVHNLFRALHRAESADHDILGALERSVFTKETIAEWGVRKRADTVETA